MKTALLLVALLLVSCGLTAEQKATLANNLAKDGAAALQGGLATGSWEGAGLAAGAQVVKNHLPVTSAKNPANVTP